MAAGDILTLEKAIAPRLVKILYGIVLALIALGAIAGVTHGVMRMTHMPFHRAGLALPGSGPADALAAPSAAPDAMTQSGERPDRMMRGFGRRHFGGRFGRRGPGMGMFGRQPPAVMGAFQIVRTLVMAAIGILLARILAEMAGAVLAMPRRSDA